jgi:hypothetical protein
MLSTHAMRKEKLEQDFDSTQSYHGTPNISVLTMNNKYVMKSPSNIVPKHKTLQQNKKTMYNLP